MSYLKRIKFYFRLVGFAPDHIGGPYSTHQISGGFQATYF